MKTAKLFVSLMIGALVAAAGHAAEKTLPQPVKEEISDSSVTAKIKSEFARDKLVSTTNIKVDTEDKGIVTLAGHAKSKAEADQAVKLAKITKGVASLKNDISVGTR